MAVGFGAAVGPHRRLRDLPTTRPPAPPASPRASPSTSRATTCGAWPTASACARAFPPSNDRGAAQLLLAALSPGSDNLNVSFTGLFDDSRDIRTFNYTPRGGSAQLSQRLTKAITLFYRFTYRRVGVSDLKITPFLIPLLSQPVRVGIGSINLVQDRRDDPVDPHRGIYNTLDLGLAEHVFGSQRNFAPLPGAQRHLPSARQAAGAGAQHGIRRHLRLPLQRRARWTPSRCPSASSAAATLRPRLSRIPGRPARHRHRLSRWAAPRCSSTRPSCASR